MYDVIDSLSYVQHVARNLALIILTFPLAFPV